MEEALGELDDEVISTLVIAVFFLEQVACCNQQDDAEDVEHPGPRVDECGAGKNESRAGDQRKDNAEKQYLLLILTRNLETSHDDEEHEQVVNAECLLGYITSEVLSTHSGFAED